MLSAQFSQVTKNKRLFAKKNQLFDSLFSKVKILTKLLILPLQMFDPPSINALYKFLQNFIKFGQFFQTFFCFARYKAYAAFLQFRDTNTYCC